MCVYNYYYRANRSQQRCLSACVSVEPRLAALDWLSTHLCLRHRPIGSRRSLAAAVSVCAPPPSRTHGCRWGCRGKHVHSPLPPCPPTPPPSSPTPTPPPPSPAITPHPTTKSLLVTPTLQQYVVSRVDRTLAVQPGASASRHPSHSADNAISMRFLYYYVLQLDIL